MRILHVIDTTGPGGAETLFVELCKRFNAGNDTSHALLRGPGWVKDQLVKSGVEHEVRDCKGSFNFGFLWHLIQLIRRKRVQVVQSHLLGSNVYCALAGALTRTPVVATFHGSVDVASSERFLRSKFAVINRSSTIVCVSEALKEDLLLRTSVDTLKLQIVKNGIDCGRFIFEKHGKLKRDRSIPADAFVVGSLGNIRPAKDYFTALRAMAQVVQQCPKVHWMVAGDINHTLHAELLDLARQLNIADHVHFLGFYEPAQEFLSGIDLYLLSSRSEGHPFSVIQAMAAGLPIIATRCGVQSMLNHDETAILVEVGSPSEMAEKILALKASPRQMMQLGSNARRQAIDQYDFEATVREYSRLYRKATGEKM
jgi:glycosyltransferase involved in cell wall biosynthesis